ncbi:hypothetical protein BD311DRAFT_244051 [Dichomitus squalens]|uniref:BTB domain-containing protein n=1 Tax=Dichomitus squalens TaxID=114155 RepID=A0A4Q9M5Q3_9APHY|nr:hypothetical protein BD311DRAFT_244051 [Dichomitus squalens]
MSASDSQQLPPVAKAGGPFDRDDTDFVIRTSDRVEFSVLSSILKLASPIFAHMFEFPQPPGSLTSKPCVDVVEDSTIMDSCLRICYPVPNPDIGSLSDLSKVLAAGLKYEAPAVIHAARNILIQPRFIDTDPLQVFATACKLGLEKEAQVAAGAAVIKKLVRSMSDSSVVLDCVSAGQYLRLLRLDSTSEVKSDGTHVVHVEKVAPFCRDHSSILETCSTEGATSSTLCPLADTPDPSADLIIKARDGVDFYVHRYVINLASPSFLGLLIEEKHPEGSIPVYHAQETSAVMDALLRYCYPFRRLKFTDADSFVRMLSVMHKYRFVTIDDLLHDYWTTFAEQSPFRFYFVAIAHAFEEKARTCAFLFARSSSSQVSELVNLYAPELEWVSALSYRRLIAYARACRAAASNIVTTFKPALPLEQFDKRSDLPPFFPFKFKPSDLPKYIEEKLAIQPSGKALTNSLIALRQSLKSQDFVLPCDDDGPGEHRLERDFVLDLMFVAIVAPAVPQAFDDSRPAIATGRRLEITEALHKYGEAVDKRVLQVRLDLTGVF